MKSNRGYIFAFVCLLGTCALLYGWKANASGVLFADRFETKSKISKISKEEQMGDYEFDKAHSSIGFRIKHMGLIDVPGFFRDFDGSVLFDSKKSQNSSVEFTAEMKSVDTRINARDNHLRSKDFFDVMTFPEMSFKSTGIKKKGKKYRIKGDLTMKGVTKSIEFPVRLYGPIKDDRGTIRMGIVGSTSVNRRQFNINYGGNLPTGVAVLSDNVVVDLQIEAVKKKTAKE